MSDRLVQASFEELEYIMGWVGEREGDAGAPTTVLVGGWAVYAYNPYFGSYDIDLVTNKKTRSTLMQHLRDERGYARVADDHLPFRGVLLRVRDVGDIKMDFASFDERDPFEGTDAVLPYELYRERVDVLDVGGLRVPIPDRSLLLLSKLKAAWDRQVRLDEGRSIDPRWERTKVVKDRADVLALVDPRRGGEGLDVVFLGERLSRLEFLVGVLERAGTDLDGIERYGSGAEEARASVARLLELTVG